MEPVSSSILHTLARIVLSALTGVPVGDRRRHATFDERIERASVALRQAGGEMAELEAELEARRAAVVQLEEQRKVLEVDRKQAEAVVRVLNKGMRADHTRALWIGLGSNAFFFIAGIAVTHFIS